MPRFLVLCLLFGCGEKRVPDGLVPPPRPPSTAAAEPKDVARWLIRAAGAEAAGDRPSADEAWAWVQTLAPDEPLLAAKFARYLVRTGRAGEALKPLDRVAPSPLGELARGEALLALGRGDEADEPLRDAGAAGLWEAWRTLVDAKLATGDAEGAASVLTTGWIGGTPTSTEARERGLRRAKVGLDATDDLLLGVGAPVAGPEDGLLLIVHAARACRLPEVRAVAARADWSGQPSWAPAVAALDATSPCASVQAYAPAPGGP